MEKELNKYKKKMRENNERKYLMNNTITCKFTCNIIIGVHCIDGE